MATRTTGLGRSPVLVGALVVVLVGMGAAFARTVPDEPTPAITDAQGRELVLRGFSTAGSAKSSADGLPDFTEDDLDRHAPRPVGQ